MRMLAAAALFGLMTATAANEKSILTHASKVAWQPVTPPGAPPGLTQRLLHENGEKQTSSAIVKFPKGYVEPRHYHTKCGHSIYVLKGKIKAPGSVWTPGSFHYAAVMEAHGPLEALEESEILFYTDGPFDYHVEKK
ncbi:MAG: cupin domain-containing protein [Bryobacteraceae bacterium]